MQIKRAGGVQPVTAIVPSGKGDADTASDSERKRPQHEGIARAYILEGTPSTTLSDMARAPLPFNVASALLAGSGYQPTTPVFKRASDADRKGGEGVVSISEAGMAAYQADQRGETVVVTRLRPDDEARGQYWDVQNLTLGGS